MRNATKEESIETIKVMLRRRLKAEKNITKPNEKFLTEKANKIYQETHGKLDPIQVLETDNKGIKP